MQSPESPFEALKFLFRDQPEVQKLLDPSMLDGAQATDQVTADLLKNEKVFDCRLNVYVTGKSRVGKTTMGNLLFGRQILNSTGHMDCTDMVQMVRIGNNLNYFDLPGAGASEEFEAFNRLALLMPPYEEEPDSFRLRTITEDEESEEDISKEDWVYNQEKCEPHVCVYMVAPNITLFNDDKRYLQQLLQSMRKRFKDKNRVVFMMNMHYINGQPIATEQQIAATEKVLQMSFREIFGEIPLPLIKGNVLKGNGLSELTKFICDTIDLNQVQTFYQDLQPELRIKANAIRNERFITLLCYIAARLSTRKADEKIADRNLLYEAYLSIYMYGMLVFYDQQETSDFSKAEAERMAGGARDSRRDREVVMEAITETVNLTKTEYHDEHEYKEKTVNEPRVYTGERKVARKPWAGTGFRDWIWPRVESYTEVVYEPRTVYVKEFKGRRAETISIGTVEKVVGQREKTIEKDYLRGGISFIQGIFSLGLGINATLSENNPNASFTFDIIFDKGVDAAAQQLTPGLRNLEWQLEQDQSASHIETEVRKILFQLFLNRK